MTNEEFLKVLCNIFSDYPWPKPLHLMKGVSLVHQGEDILQAARLVKTTPRTLEYVLNSPDPVSQVLGLDTHSVKDQYRQKAIRILGQLLLGRCAELAFERIYRAEMKTHDLELRDLRESRTDTDYRLYNGRGMPVYRINIKFHGSRFRRAPELVGLNPHDCFALATYKIYSALEKQQAEGLPYFFAIVGVPHLSGENVGKKISSQLVESVALMHQAPHAKSKRSFEDAIIDYLIRESCGVFTTTFEDIYKSDWYILSARKADKLLREFLFERVFALKIRNFAQVFRGAELDMHFSLSRDLTPLRSFLNTLRKEGTHKVTTLLERGEF